jgi:hypothetical protein
MESDIEVSSRAWRNIAGSAVLTVNYLVQNVVYKPPLSKAFFFILRLGSGLATNARTHVSPINLPVRHDMLQQSARSDQ